MMISVGDLSKLIISAEEGMLTDTDRIRVYQLALSVAANELHRIELTAPGTVNPASLAALQQLALIVEGEPEQIKERAVAHADTTEPAPSGLIQLVR